MYIVFFNRSYWPDQAATGQLLTELTEDLVRDYGCQVSVVAGVPLHESQREQSPQPGWKFIRSELHNGVQILRASGTVFSPRKFVARATNYVSYFSSACVAGFRASRPDVVVALTDPPNYRSGGVDACAAVASEVRAALSGCLSRSGAAARRFS